MSDTTPTVVQLQQQIAALQDLVMSLQQSQSLPAPTQAAPPSVSGSSHQLKGLKVAAPDVFDGSLSKSEAFLSEQPYTGNRTTQEIRRGIVSTQKVCFNLLNREQKNKGRE